MGHALNKCIKDFMIRSAAMRGYYTPYIPGWDNHGMPIESAIIKKNKLNHKAMPIPEFRSACHDFAQHYIDVQMEGFKRLGVVADWEHPYKTMAPSFEAEEVKVFGAMYKKGYIYKGLKPVYWCYHDETALAEAEIEYQDDPCTTVYVKFPLHDDQGKLTDEEKKNLSFVIWTTTIWTLPGNLAIALNPVESYVIVRNHQNGEQYLVAEALMEKVMKVGGVEDYTVVSRHEGAFFENMLADHPFLPKTSRLVLADYVTMDSGTGCVHTAPGFGADDYQTCRRYGMDMVVPVNDQGRHTDYAGKYAGMLVEESNPVILKDMQESGALFASEQIVHSYPHCWRCKKPIIFRATPQWFCSVESFKDAACAACDDVRWLPAWGIDRMKAMIRERADWCISRQRRWGLPIPVFYCKDCGKPVCTDETIAKISKLFGEFGSNVWFEKDADELVPEGFACPHCGGRHFEKETDTLDGWFDSGSTHFASMQKDQGFWPATVYLEGLDQYRGWFQSSLLTAVGALGKGAPFKECVTHGWTVDGEGKAMHKSLGNGVDPADVFKKYGADICRLWAGSADYHVDVRCSDEIFKQLSQNYLKFRNTAKFCLDNLTDFDPNQLTAPAGMEALDRWAITKLNELLVKCEAAYQNYEFLTVSPRRQRFLRRDAFEPLSRYHQGPPVLRRRGFRRPPLGTERTVDHSRRHDEGLRAHPRVHLRRDLAPDAAPQRRRRPQRAAEPDVDAVCGLRAARVRNGRLGDCAARPLGRQRRAGNGPRRQAHRQEPRSARGAVCKRRGRKGRAGCGQVRRSAGDLHRLQRQHERDCPRRGRRRRTGRELPRPDRRRDRGERNEVPALLDALRKPRRARPVPALRRRLQGPRRCV